MPSKGIALWAAMLALGAAGQAIAAAETRTWYVYCEGAGAGRSWAVLSDNLWPHDGSADYGRRIGDAAKAFFEARHDVPLEGCAGVGFRDDDLARHSRETTVRLHRRLGDRVYFFPLPTEVWRMDVSLRSDAVPGADADDGGGAIAVSDGSVARSADPPWRPMAAPR